jgi:hypothetical protein
MSPKCDFPNCDKTSFVMILSSLQRFCRDHARQKLKHTCGCCGQFFPNKSYLVNDHDHKTGRSRDRICYSCNTVVGRVEGERAVLSFQKRQLALDYVARWNNRFESVRVCSGHAFDIEDNTEAL